VQLVQKSSLQMLTVGAFRSPHRSPVKLASFLTSMNCLPTPHYLPKMTAEHSTLIREPWRIPCGPPTALEMSAQTQTSGHVHSRLTSRYTLFQSLPTSAALQVRVSRQPGRQADWFVAGFFQPKNRPQLVVSHHSMIECLRCNGITNW